MEVRYNNCVQCGPVICWARQNREKWYSYSSSIYERQIIAGDHFRTDNEILRKAHQQG
jgi:hypothetical protein